MTDEFDDRIRSQMRQNGGSPGQAFAALESLRPAMRRARRRRNMAVGSMTLATVALAVVGAAALGSALRSPTNEQTMTFVDGTLPPPVVTDDSELAEPTSHDSALPAERNESEADGRIPDENTPDVWGAPGAQVPTGPDTGAPPSTQLDDDGLLPTISTTRPRATTTSVVTTPTTPPPVATTGPTTTVAKEPPTITTTPTTTPTTTTTTATTTTTPSSSGERLIGSECGTITVSFDLTAVTLLGAQPDPGFATDVKSSGPDDVEVGFASGDLECQIHAEMSAGRLVVRVENPGD